MSTMDDKMITEIKQLADADFDGGLVNGMIPRDCDGVPIMLFQCFIPEQTLLHIVKEYGETYEKALYQYKRQWFNRVASTPIADK